MVALTIETLYSILLDRNKPRRHLRCVHTGRGAARHYAEQRTASGVNELSQGLSEINGYGARTSLLNDTRHYLSYLYIIHYRYMQV